MSIVLVVGCVGTALAAEPVIVIGQPHTGFSTNDQTPAFRVTTSDTLDPVTLDIYVGENTVVTPVQERTMSVPVEVGLLEATWEIAPESPARPGAVHGGRRTDERRIGNGQERPGHVYGRYDAAGRVDQRAGLADE